MLNNMNLLSYGNISTIHFLLLKKWKCLTPSLNFWREKCAYCLTEKPRERGPIRREIKLKINKMWHSVPRQPNLYTLFKLRNDGSDSMKQREEWSLLQNWRVCSKLFTFTINKQGKLWHVRHYKNHLVHEKGALHKPLNYYIAKHLNFQFFMITMG